MQSGVGCPSSPGGRRAEVKTRLFALVRTRGRGEEERRHSFCHEKESQCPKKRRGPILRPTLFLLVTHRYPRRARKARVVQRSDAGRKSKARPDQTINGTFWDYNPKKAEHSGNIIPIFTKLKTYRRDGQGFGGASNAFAKLAGSAGSWSILSGETTVTGMFG